jgi:biotin-(acetyl-CoA carboxylase) ligase
MMKCFDEAGFSPMVEEWDQWHAYQNKDVSLVLPGGKRETGRVEGVDAGGALLIRPANGALERYSSGELSLRPHHPGPVAL